MAMTQPASVPFRIHRAGSHLKKGLVAYDFFIFMKMDENGMDIVINVIVIYCC